MPFAVLIVGLFLIIAGVRNTQDDLFGLVKGDFTGQDNFIFWLIAILVIGSIGYIERLRPLSNSFLVLIILVLFLKKGNANGVGGGFFKQFTDAIGGTTSSSSTGTQTQAQQIQSAIDTLRNQIEATIKQEQGTIAPVTQ